MSQSDDEIMKKTFMCLNDNLNEHEMSNDRIL